MIPLPNPDDLPPLPAILGAHGEEFREQVRLVQYLRRHWATIESDRRPIIFAVPNGGSRNKAEASNMKASGTLAGVPDLIILSNGSKATFIEMKSAKGKASPAQLAFRQSVAPLGFAVIEARSAYDALVKMGCRHQSPESTKNTYSE